MEATGSMPSDIAFMGVPTVTGIGPANATGLNSMDGIPAMTGIPSMPGMVGSSCKIDMLWNWYTIDACFLSHSWQITSHGMFAGSCIGVFCLVLCLEALRRLGREYDAFVLRRARQRQMDFQEPPLEMNTEPSTAENNTKACCLRTDPASKADGNDIHPEIAKAPPSQQHHIIFPPEVSSESCSSNPQVAGTDNGAHWPLVTPQPQRRAISARLLRTDAAEQQQQQRVRSVPREIHHRPSPVEQIVRALLHTLQFGIAYIVMLLAMYYNGYLIICIFIGAFLGSLIFSWEEVSLDKQ
ncbi:hypothetical protein N7450_005001 [Penicillium hetheringtonii]|uniref:Copper transport protein n=1 Tax=Penicillium hetheringtonii TaxID=911720 RepID=A0AAD6GWV5_9EURO|nr:hypothetical protein N7450_005001 [Penicillium hetheringtonii]